MQVENIGIRAHFFTMGIAALHPSYLPNLRGCVGWVERSDTHQSCGTISPPTGWKGAALPINQPHEKSYGGLPAMCRLHIFCLI
jgi:hypothetical protein